MVVVFCAGFLAAFFAVVCDGFEALAGCFFVANLVDPMRVLSPINHSESSHFVLGIDSAVRIRKANAPTSGAPAAICLCGNTDGGTFGYQRYATSVSEESLVIPSRAV